MEILLCLFCDIRVSPTPTSDYYAGLYVKENIMYTVFSNISPIGERIIFSALSRDNGRTWPTRFLVSPPTGNAFYPDADAGRGDTIFVVAKDDSYNGFFYYVVVGTRYAYFVSVDVYTWYRNLMFPRISVDENTGNKFIAGELNSRIRVIFEENNQVSFVDLEGITCYTPEIVKGDGYSLVGYRVGTNKITLAKSSFAVSSWSYSNIEDTEISFFDLYYDSGRVGIVYNRGNKLLFTCYEEGIFGTPVEVVEDNNITNAQIAMWGDSIFIAYIKNSDVYLFTSEDKEHFNGPFKISDTSTVIDSLYSFDVISMGGTAFVCWLDDRNDSTDIYGDVVDVNGIQLKEEKNILPKFITKFISLDNIDFSFYRDMEKIVTLDGRDVTKIERKGIYFVFSNDQVLKLIVWR